MKIKLLQMFHSFIYSVLSHRFNKIIIIMRNKNLIFFVQPNEASFTAPERLMKTYMNRYIITEDDQVRFVCNVYVSDYHIKWLI